MHGGDKQGQLSVAVELPELVWVLMRYHWSSLLWVGTKCTSTCSQVTLLCAFCADPHGNLQGRDGQGPHNLREQKHEGPLIGLPLPLQRKRMCQRHPLRRGHLGEVVSSAQNGQAPTVGLAPAARRWSGSQNASCFFGRSLRNVHFGNARLTPQIHTSHSALPITILAITRWDQREICTCSHMAYTSCKSTTSTARQSDRRADSRGMTWPDTP